MDPNYFQLAGRCLLALITLSVHLGVLFAETEADDLEKKPKRLVVLKNGNVLRGRLSRNADFVTIHSGGAELRLPRGEIELVVDDLEQAYQRKAALVSAIDARARIRLIRWCLRQRLVDHARSELEQLKDEHPLHPLIGLVSRQIDQFQPEVRSIVLPEEAPLPPNRQFAATQIDRLPRDAIATFSKQIQPLLVNRCATAGCHGPAAPSRFQLVRAPGRRMSQGITQQNLGATLRQIGKQRARETLLWMSASSVHGGLKARPMATPELTELLEWIQQVQSDNEQPRVARADRLQPFRSRRPEKDPFDPELFNRLQASPGKGASTGVSGE